MRTLYRLLLGLYPARVKSEFTQEMMDVFDQAYAAEKLKGIVPFLRFCARETGGLLTSLLTEERTMTHKRRVLAGGIAGLLIGAAAGAGVAAWRPQTYTSTAVFRATASTVPERLVPAQARLELQQVVPRLAQTVLSRGNLAVVIKMHNLYPDAQTSVPMEDIVEEMRRALRITAQSDSVFEVSFTYPDRILAQKVTGDFVGRIVSEYTRERRTMTLLTVQFLKDSVESAGATWEERLAKVRQAASAGRPLERVTLDASIAKQRYENLSERLAEAEMLQLLEQRQQGQTLEVVSPASSPSDSGAAPTVAAVVGAMSGALVGLLVSSVMWHRSRLPLAEAV